MTKTKIFGAALALTMAMGGNAWADCGAAPTPPAIPADGAAIPGKEMEVLANDFDAYQQKFIKFNECARKEYDDVQKKFETVLDAYQAKNAPKKK